MNGNNHWHTFDAVVVAVAAAAAGASEGPKPEDHTIHQKRKLQ